MASAASAGGGASGGAGSSTDSKTGAATPVDATAAEFNECVWGLFHAVDSNKDGYITEDEVLEFGKSMGFEDDVVSAKWDTLKATLDKDRDGKVSKQEFQRFAQVLLAQYETRRAAIAAMKRLAK